METLLTFLYDRSNISLMSRRAETMNRTDTREELVRVGTGIIAKKGFSITGIDAVLKTTGVPKGSFYYYFSSKEEFGVG